jgi:two-component system phosphate regulon sensor histidine kinase PhoR
VTENKQKYRRSLFLISLFIGLISVALIITLFFSFLFTQKLIESKFNNDRSAVLDSTVIIYNEFIFNEIPTLSLYKGFLDSNSVSDLSKDYFKKFPFIEQILFYDVEISNQPIQDGFSLDKFSVGVKAVYNFVPESRSSESSVLFRKGEKGSFSIREANDLSRSVLKFTEYIASLENNFSLTNEDIFKIFYTFYNDYVSFINVPREADLRIYSDLMYKDLPLSPKYDQDVITFKLNPTKLPITNTNASLFEYIEVKPIYFDSLQSESGYLTASAPLPGALGDFQLYFISSKKHISKWVATLFAPLALIIIVVYGIMVLIGLLIYRNLNVNQRMFKLQYDFINNISHEFKTPVSVIKIAGNNMKTSDNLKVAEIKHYGKILDEEADKLNNLMTKLLSITQLENKTIQFHKEQVILSDFIQSVLNEYSIRYPDFVITHQLKEVETLFADPVILASIFQNFIDNAYKYNESSPKTLKINIFKEKKNTIVEFTDNGIGISENELQNIFEKFYRINNQFNQTGSAGIGLAFSSEMVKAMDGKISVTSTLGSGTTFRLQFTSNKNHG